MPDPALKRFFDGVADLAVVGLLMIATSLPVLTSLAALTGAVQALDGTGPGSVPARYLAAFRRALPSTVKPQLALLTALVVGTTDVVVGVRLGTRPHPSLVAAPVLACGVLLVGAALVLPPYLAALPGAAGSGRTAIHRAAVSASAHPATSLTLLLLIVTLVAIGTALPVLSPLLVGAYAFASLGLVRRVAPRSHPRRPLGAHGVVTAAH